MKYIYRLNNNILKLIHKIRIMNFENNTDGI